MLRVRLRDEEGALPVLAIVWRVMGDSFDVDAFLTRHALSTDAVWHKGDMRFSRREPATGSGFNLSVDRDDDDLSHALVDIRSFLIEKALVLKELQELRVESTLDVGVTVGDDVHFTRSIRFPPDILQGLASAGIELEVSAYPCSDEDEPNQGMQPTGSAGG